MAQPGPPEAPTSAAGTLPTEVESTLNRIEASVSSIRNDLRGVCDTKALECLSEDLKRVQKFTERLKTAVQKKKLSERILGAKDLSTLVISLIALALSGFSLQLSFFGSPDIRVSPGQELQLSFDPQTNEFALDFKIVIANHGRKMDVVDLMQSQLSWESGGAPLPVIFPSDSITLNMPSGLITFPFSVRDNSATEMQVHAVQRVGTDEKVTSFFDPSGFNPPSIYRRHRLTLDLRTGAGNTRRVSTCFDFTKTILDDIRLGKMSGMHTVECSELN